MKIQKIITILFSITLSSYSCLIIAAPALTIGRVISVEGQVAAINQENQQRSLQRHSVIYLHDKIVTQQESKVQLILQDDSVVVVQESSEFYVSEFSFNKNVPSNNKYVGNIVKGALINMSGRGEPKNYRLDSPLVTIAFRGTGLATKLFMKNNIPVDQEINVFQGYVTVSTICKQGIGVGCQPFHVDIGVGQRFNSATVSMLGVIKGLKSFKALEKSESANAASTTSQVMTQQSVGEGGGVVVKCKGSR